MNDLITKIEQMQAEARDGMKRASRDSDPYLYQYLVGKFHAFGKVAGILKKQKEPHYTKRNALFDKCVENCDPATMKRVSDEVDEMLEKEQKPAEWSEEDRLHYANVLEALEYVKGCKSDYDKIEAVKSDIAWFKSLPKRFNLQPKQEWNKKDENKLYQVIDTLLADKAEALRDNPHCKALHEAFDDMIDWLKSLRPVSKESLQPHWKPSEEQMKWLKDVIETVPMTCRQQVPLESLYNDLKKL